MRWLAVALLRWLAEALVRLYYPRRTVEGATHVPLRGPTMYVANHPNGLLDPLLFRVITGHPIRFLAKSTLWGNPFGRLAMDAFQCLPVYRQQDVRTDERGQSVRRNEEAFARCRAELALGAELALYPEGTSHSDPHLRPLKSGAARIALSAAAEAAATTDGRTGLVMIPAGTYYEDKAVFRSGVHLVIGAPIDLSGHVNEFSVDPKRAIDSLTDEIRERLNALVLQAETRELIAGIARVASWTAADADDDSPARRHARTRELLAAYSALKAKDPERLEQVARAVRQYARVLEHLGVSDPWAVETPRISSAQVAFAMGRAVLMLPAAVWGLITSWGPYRFSGMVAARMTRDEDVLSTIKMIVGTTFLVVAWIIEAIALGWFFGLGWGLGALAIAPAAGYAALRLGETLREVSEALHHLGWRNRAATVQDLANRRRRLAQEVAQALRQVDHHLPEDKSKDP
ncbi:MAG: 1-acyl-sn-glycerol-3-phosphate acyltransferase [Deltaproteobacteria bacterium]|nr:1-acyl-sn-glycerol-3-phosphate acyltransferase [Deltaproteobacteria bacterium]